MAPSALEGAWPDAIFGCDGPLWIYVRKDAEGVVAKARPGQDFIVTGTVMSADIRMFNGSPQLNANIEAKSVKSGK